MSRSSIRARLPFRGVTVPTVPVLYGRIPVQPMASCAQRRSFTHSRRFNLDLSTDPIIKMGERKAELENLNEKPLNISYTELRDLCKCSLCVDEHSKQRNFRLSDIPPNIKPRTLEWKEGALEATWKNDISGFDSTHVSRFPREQLQPPWKYKGIYSPTGQKRPRLTWSRGMMTDLQPWISYEDYMHDDAKFTTAMSHLARLGILFLRDIPDSREMVEKIATRIGPLRNTFYGPTWDVRTVPQAKNVAYTNQFLGFHMDLMYMDEAPGFQLLHCLQNSCDGGESLFADAFRVAEYMYHHKRPYFDALTKFSIPYEYMHSGHQYKNWRPVFQLGSRASQSNFLEAVNYSPPFQGPLKTLNNGSESELAHQQFCIEALKFFADSLERKNIMFEMKLKPGECVIFENRRIVHARRHFNTASGERWLAGAYLDNDVTLSRFRVSKKSHPQSWDHAVGLPIAFIRNRVRASKLASKWQQQSEGNDGGLPLSLIRDTNQDFKQDSEEVGGPREVLEPRESTEPSQQ